MVSILRLTFSTLALGTMALVTSRAMPEDKPKAKPEPPAITKKVAENKTETPKKLFSKDEIASLIDGTSSLRYKVRAVSSLKLLKIAKEFSPEETTKFLIYILKEQADIRDSEVDRRLHLVVEKAIESMIEKAAVEAKSPKRYETLTILIKTMEGNRSQRIWGALLPVTANLIKQEAELNNRYSNSYYGYRGDLQLDPQAVKQVSTLLTSTVNDSEELQEVTLNQAALWTQPPFQEWGPFIALHTSKLENLARLSGDKLGEIERGLNGLKKIYPKLDPSFNVRPILAYSSKKALGEILDLNVIALSENDPKKREQALSNIDAVSALLDFPSTAHRPSTSKGAILFQNRAEFSKKSPSVSELQSAINLAQTIPSMFTGSDTEYHKSYVNWLQRSIDDISPATPNKTEKKGVLVTALENELNAIAKAGDHVPLQETMIKPLIDTYSKLINKNDIEPESLEHNIDCLVKLEYFSYYHLNSQAQEEPRRKLLALFDTLAEKVDRVQNEKDKSSLKMQLLTAVPRIISYSSKEIESAPNEEQRADMKASNERLERISKDYLPRILRLYKDQEISQLVKKLLSLDPQWKQWSQGVLPAELMLRYLKDDFDHFGRKTEEIVKKYNEAKDPAAKASLRKQIGEINSSFQLLFKQEEIASNAWIGQFICTTGVTDDLPNSPQNGNWRRIGWIHLDSREDLKVLIREIKRLYQDRLQAPIDRILSEPRRVDGP